MRANRPILTALTVVAALLACQAAAADDVRLPAPVYDRALALRARGDLAGALAALEGETGAGEQAELPIEALILRAQLLAELGLAEQSEQDWGAVARRAGSLRSFAQGRIVLSLAARGQPAAAEEILQELTSRDGLRRHASAAVEVAQAHLAAGSAQEAARLFRSVIGNRRSGSDADKSRLGLAAALEMTGDPAGAVLALRSAQLRFVLPETYAEAATHERRVCEAAGREVEHFSEDQYRQMVQRLCASSRFDPALELIGRWRQAHPDSNRQDEIEREHIEILYRKRSNAEARRRCIEFAERFDRSRYLAGVYLTLLRLAVRGGLTEQVVELAAQIRGGEVRGASSAQRHSAGVILAAYLVSIGQVENGLDVYRELYRAGGSRSQLRNIHWRAAIAALIAEQHGRSVANLEALLRLSPSGEVELAARFWLGVAEARRGDVAAGLRSLLTVAERYPLHYYGVRAREQVRALAGEVPSGSLEGLREQATVEPLQFPELELSASVRRNPLFSAAELLSKAGLLQDAARMVRSLLERSRGDRAVALCAARACAASGSYRVVSSIIATYFPQYLTRHAQNLPVDFWSMAFPRPFWEEICRAAAAQRVDPLLMASLMRRESRFDPEAVSVAGAVGLFQIMPYTASELGPDLGLGTPGAEQLQRPEVNAAIAAGLVARLLERFDKNLVPTVAAYNAGEDRVAAWWQAGRELEEELFVDSIPYRETRLFVREVLHNYYYYTRLYPPRLPVEGGSK